MLKHILAVLSPKRRKQFVLVLFISLASTVGEFTMLASLLLFISSITNPGDLLNNSVIQFLDQIFSLGLADIAPRELISILGIVVIIMLVVKGVLRSTAVYVMHYYSTIVGGEFGYEIMKNIVHAEHEWVLLQDNAGIIQSVEWREHIKLYLAGVFLVLSEISVAVLVIVALIALQPVLSISLFLIFGLFAIFIFSLLKKYIDKKSQEITELKGDVFAVARNAINSLKDLFIFHLEADLLTNLKNKFTILNKKHGIQALLANLPAIIIEFIGFLALVIISIILLGIATIATEDILGILSLFAIAAWRIIPASIRVMNGLVQIRIARPYCRKVIALVNSLADHPHVWQTGEQRIHQLETLSLNDLSYKYKTGADSVLKSLNLSINKGERVGIIGQSGAGKSTLVDVLTGLLVPQGGEVRINNISLSEINRSEWLQHIGYVAQAPFFHDGSIAENIVFGRGNMDEVYLQQICKQVSMEFLNDLPSGVHTRMGEKGVRLSGGQLQRIAIARALYRKPTILIFDEATSALDNSTEKSIMDTIYSLGGITMLIIAHRLNTVKRCDKILWLDAGEMRGYNSPETIIPQYELAFSQNDNS